MNFQFNILNIRISSFLNRFRRLNLISFKETGTRLYEVSITHQFRETHCCTQKIKNWRDSMKLNYLRFASRFLSVPKFLSSSSLNSKGCNGGHRFENKEARMFIRAKCNTRTARVSQLADPLYQTGWYSWLER